MSSWQLHWLTDWNEIWSEEFQAQWYGWMEQSCSSHIFFHPALARAWVETYLPLQDIAPLFLVARQKSLTVFLPLILWRRNWKHAFLREVVPLGYSDFDYHDPIITGPLEDFDRNDFWTALIAELENLGLLFDRLHIPGITERFAGTGMNWSDGEICPYCDISTFGKPEEFLPMLDKHKRGELRRRIRRLEEHGALTFKVYTKDQLDEALKILPDFLKFHTNRWPNSYKAPHFHENILKLGLSAGVVHFSELRLSDKPISWRLGFVSKIRFYSYMPAFDSQWEKFSPGQIHLLMCIEDAILLGLEIYDNLRGEESYKNKWAKKLSHLNNFTVRDTHLLSRTKCSLVDMVMQSVTHIMK